MRKIIVEPSESVVEYRDGVLVGVLAAGRYPRQRRSRYVPVDRRSTITQVAPQEVLTADGVSIKVSVSLQWSVVDPVAYLEQTQDPLAVVYLAVQLELRERLSELEVAEVVRQGRRAVTDALTTAAIGAATPLGIAVTAAQIKDVVVPAELRAAYAELVTIKQRAQAQLETARAETAALRSMANAAKLLDDHPALARLRMIQAAPYGSTLVIKVGEGHAASSDG